MCMGRRKRGFDSLPRQGVVSCHILGYMPFMRMEFEVFFIFAILRVIALVMVMVAIFTIIFICRQLMRMYHRLRKSNRQGEWKQHKKGDNEDSHGGRIIT